MNGKFPARLSSVKEQVPVGAEYLIHMSMDVTLEIDGSVANSGSLLSYKKGDKVSKTIYEKMLMRIASYYGHKEFKESILEDRSVYAVYQDNILIDIVLYNLNGAEVSLSRLYELLKQSTLIPSPVQEG